MRRGTIRADEERYAHPAQSVLILMQAVLEDGIRSLLHNFAARSRYGQRRGREELAWFTSRDRTDLFAFENVCDALGIDASRLRSRVLAAGARVTAERRPATPPGTIPYRSGER